MKLKLGFAAIAFASLLGCQKEGQLCAEQHFGTVNVVNSAWNGIDVEVILGTSPVPVKIEYGKKHTVEGVRSGKIDLVIRASGFDVTKQLTVNDCESTQYIIN